MRLSALALILSAAPALAQPDIRQLLIDGARASGCVLTDDYAERTFPPLGLTKEDVRPVAEAMIAAGEAELVGGNFELSAGLCDAATGATEPPPSPKAEAVLEVFRAHGCVLTEAEGMPLLAAAGITEADMEALEGEFEALFDAGLLTRMGDDAGTIRLEEPLCSGADAAAPLIRLLRDNGCRMTQDQAAPIVGGYGMTMETADEMADSLLDRGMARLEGEALVLTDCGG